MRFASEQIRLAAVILLPLAVPLGCAAIGESAPLLAERDADPGTIPQSDAGGSDKDALADAGPCSASKLCRIAAPIEDTDRVLSIWGSGATDVWAVGSNGLILHYDGALWEQAERVGDSDASSEDFTLRAVWLGARDDVWLADGPRIRHSTGWTGKKSAWSFYPNQSALGNACPVTAMRGLGARVWISFELCTTWMMRFDDGFDGGDASTMETRAGVLDSHPTALAVTGADEVWVATNDRERALFKKSNIVRVRFEGAGGDSPEPNWILENYDANSRLGTMGLWGNEAVVWAVGEMGTLRRLNRADPSNRKFELVAGPTTETLYGVFGFGVDDVWAVGGESSVLHWDGESWTKLATPFDHAKRKPRLWAVWGSSSGDVWIVGDGTILRYQTSAP